MTISFNAIPVGVRTPGAYIEFDNTRAFQGLPALPHKILVIGQRLTAGTIAAEMPVRITDAGQGKTYFGRGSMLAHMIAALAAVNRTTEAWAVALDDVGAGTAAAGDVDFGGAPTEAGTYALYIGGRPVKIAVAVAADPADLATALAAAITALPDLPVTAAVNGVDDTIVDITARHKGTNGNDIDLRANYYEGEATPAGLTAAITAMSGGATNPDIADALAAIGDEQYRTIVMPWTDAANLTALETELATRWGPMVMTEGMAYAGARGTHSALGTLGDSRNSEFVSIMGAEGSPTPPHEWAAAVAGIAAFHGNIDPARPFQTLAVPGVLPPALDVRHTREERDLLLHDGISTFTVDAGGVVRIERLITTYKTNPAGIDDPSYLDVNTLLTLAYLRYSLRARIQLKFPRHKLANDGTQFGAGQAIVTPKIIRAEIIALFRQWEEAGLAENVDQFKADLIVERDGTDPNRVNALVPPDIVNQLRIFAAQVQFRL